MCFHIRRGTVATVKRVRILKTGDEPEIVEEKTKKSVCTGVEIRKLDL